MLRQITTKPTCSARWFNVQIRASHYDVLGVTPKASQTDIKSAYYKLSKVYHPDKSPDEAAAIKFRALTEAYEVLGNVKLKNMYDKGLLVEKKPSSQKMSYDDEPEPTDPSLRFYKSRSKRHIVPTMDGRTPIYNFDAWAKNHYRSLYEKKKYEEEFVKERNAKQAEAAIAHRQETIMFMVFVFGGFFLMLGIRGTSDYDRDGLSDKRNAELQSTRNGK